MDQRSTNVWIAPRRTAATRTRPIAILAIVAVVMTWTVASGAVAQTRASTRPGTSRCSAKDAATLKGSRGDPGRWSWLAGTTWYVPRSGLPASAYDPKTGASAPVRDQTVYTIANYTDGYFSGKTVIQTTAPGSAPSVLLRNLVASVTPRGAVMLTFVPPDPDRFAAHHRRDRHVRVSTRRVEHGDADVDRIRCDAEPLGSDGQLPRGTDATAGFPGRR